MIPRVFAPIAIGFAFGTTVIHVFELISHKTTRAELAETEVQLGACGARLANIMEVAESNATIPEDLADFTVPDAWLRPNAGDGE